MSRGLPMMARWVVVPVPVFEIYISVGSYGTMLLVFVRCALHAAHVSQPCDNALPLQRPCRVRARQACGRRLGAWPSRCTRACPSAGSTPRAPPTAAWQRAAPASLEACRARRRRCCPPCRRRAHRPRARAAGGGGMAASQAEAIPRSRPHAGRPTTKRQSGAAAAAAPGLAGMSGASRAAKAAVAAGRWGRRRGPCRRPTGGRAALTGRPRSSSGRTFSTT